MTFSRFDRQLERASIPTVNDDKYYSVEFSIKGLAVQYQFKIWRIGQMSMCLLVKEGSEVLRRIKVGDTVEMRYYSTESAYPSDYLKTAIRDIVWNENGRFKGHCTVGLEILGSEGTH